MKLLRSILITAVAIMISIAAYSQARLQLIHNSADEATSVVDIWMDNELIVDDFAFRTASAFMDGTAGIEFTLAVCDPGSQKIARQCNE